MLKESKYTGNLPIGDIDLECAVLEDGMRILTASSIFSAFDRTRKGINDRLEINGTKIPPFLAAKNIEPYLSAELIELCIPIQYKDGSSIKEGYTAILLPKMCSLYLKMRREDALTGSQEKLALKSEILLEAFAQVGIDALVDEATGYQRDRKHDALRILLNKYLAESLQRWLLTFPDSFFLELDRLYGNEQTTSRKRPQYYGNFINKYIYEPIEYGFLKSRLDELNIGDDGKRKARFHQWLSQEGRNILVHQIGRVQGMMESCNNISDFKKREQLKKQISIAPYLFEEMNDINRLS